MSPHPEQLVSVPNWVDEKIFAPAAGEWKRMLPTDRTWLMYAGGVGELQALQHAIRAVHLLGDRTDIGLAVVGDGVARPALERLACQLGVDERVLFLGSRPMEEMPMLAGSARFKNTWQTLPMSQMARDPTNTSS